MGALNANHQRYGVKMTKAGLPALWKAFLCLVLVATALMLNGCASPTDEARSILDRLEFEKDEYGSFELEGTLDLNPLPMFNTNVHMKLEKVKDKPAPSPLD